MPTYSACWSYFEMRLPWAFLRVSLRRSLRSTWHARWGCIWYSVRRVFTLRWADEFPLPTSAFVTGGMLRRMLVTLPIFACVVWDLMRPATSLLWPIFIAACVLTYLLTARLGNLFPAFAADEEDTFKEGEALGG